MGPDGGLWSMETLDGLWNVVLSSTFTFHFPTVIFLWCCICCHREAGQCCKESRGCRICTLVVALVYISLTAVVLNFEFRPSEFQVVTAESRLLWSDDCESFQPFGSDGIDGGNFDGRIDWQARHLALPPEQFPQPIDCFESQTPDFLGPYLLGTMWMRLLPATGRPLAVGDAAADTPPQPGAVKISQEVKAHIKNSDDASLVIHHGGHRMLDEEPAPRRRKVTIDLLDAKPLLSEEPVHRSVYPPPGRNVHPIVSICAEVSAERYLNFKSTVYVNVTKTLAHDQHDLQMYVVSLWNGAWYANQCQEDMEETPDNWDGANVIKGHKECTVIARSPGPYRVVIMMPPSTKRTQQLCGSASKYEYKVEFHETMYIKPDSTTVKPDQRCELELVEGQADSTPYCEMPLPVGKSYFALLSTPDEQAGGGLQPLETVAKVEIGFKYVHHMWVLIFGGSALLSILVVGAFHFRYRGMEVRERERGRALRQGLIGAGREIVQPTGLADSEVLARVSFLRSSRDRKQFRDRYDAVMAAAEAVKKDAGPPLPVAVARESVMRDAFHVLGRRPRVSDWRRRFRVVFRNEDGIDAGGVTREFFNVAIRQLCDPNFGLIIESEDGGSYEISPHSFINPEHLEFFTFFGRMLAKSIVEHVSLDSHFTPAFYGNILGRDFELTDLQAVDFELYEGLLKMREYDDEVLEELDLVFTTDEEQFGMVGSAALKEIELKEGGAEIPVTRATIEEYIVLKAEYRVVGRVSEQRAALRAGFASLFGPNAMERAFGQVTPRELELIMHGLPTIDIAEWRRCTKYRSGYSEAAAPVKFFWRVLESYDDEMQAAVLRFVTGSARVPLDGFANLRGKDGVKPFTIQRVDWPLTKLPQAATCFNVLHLPPYRSAAALMDRLTTAVLEGSEGFHLR